MLMRKYLVLGIAYLVTACSTPEAFKPPGGILWFERTAACISRQTEIPKELDICRENEIAKGMSIYNKCKIYLIKIDGVFSNIPADCQNHESWLQALKVQVSKQKEIARMPIDGKIQHCLDKEHYWDYTTDSVLSFPHCIGVTKRQAYDAYDERKQKRIRLEKDYNRIMCNHYIKRSADSNRKGDYYTGKKYALKANEHCP